MKIFTRYDGMVRALRRLTDLTIDDHFDAVINLSVERFAENLEHPRNMYVLPNGDVLVAETNAPPGRMEGIEGWIANTNTSS